MYSNAEGQGIDNYEDEGDRYVFYSINALYLSPCKELNRPTNLGE